MNILDTSIPLNDKTLLEALTELKANTTQPVQIRPTRLLVSPEIAEILPALAAKHGFATVKEFVDAVLAGA